jgi:hypothetical protein
MLSDLLDRNTYGRALVLFGVDDETTMQHVSCALSIGQSAGKRSRRAGFHCEQG